MKTFRPLAPLDAPAWPFKRGFCTYSARNKLSCAGPILPFTMRGSRVRAGGQPPPPPPEKSQKYRVSKQYWSGCPENHKATKPASIHCLAIIGTPAKRHLSIHCLAIIGTPAKRHLSHSLFGYHWHASETPFKHSLFGYHWHASETPFKHSLFGYHWHASETPFKHSLFGYHWHASETGDDGPLVVVFESSLPSSTAGDPIHWLSQFNDISLNCDSQCMGSPAFESVTVCSFLG